MQKNWRLLNTWRNITEQANSDDLAAKLNVSKRTVQRMVQQLRDHGYPIKFNRFRNSYEVEK